MSAPNTSSSSSQLIAYAQDIDYTCMEGFKQFKSWYNVKNTQAACNDPNGTYPSAETVYQAIVIVMTFWYVFRNGLTFFRTF